jgi:hypothetical protein
LDVPGKVGIFGVFGNGLVAVPLTDDVIDSVFESVDGEFIGIGELPAFSTEQIERFVHGKEKGVRRRQEGMPLAF